MAVPGYPAQPARLAFRKAPVPGLLEELREVTPAGGTERAEAAEELAAVTDAFLDEWVASAIRSLDSTLAKLAEHSDQQLAILTALVEGAGISVSDVDDAPASPDFAWDTAARSAVSALLDVLVDTYQDTFDAGGWVKECVSKLNVERFTQASGIGEQDHDTLLGVTAGALLELPARSVDIEYRDRLARLNWDGETVTARAAGESVSAMAVPAGASSPTGYGY